MLRDLNVSSGGKRDSTDPRVGVLASEIPTGFPLPAFLLNDIDSGFPNRLYSLELLTLPSAGTLYLDKTSAGTFTGAPDGVYTGTQRVRKYDPGTGLVSTADGTYSLTVGAAASTVSGVTVSPSTATGSTTFSATVAGTNSPSQAVTWTATAGSITSGGVFTAPAATGSVQTITVTARSVQDNTKAGTATVTIAAVGSPTVTTVTVSPSTATGSATFAATVNGTNSPSQAVTWTASAGVITSGGVFTAPAATGSIQTITITARSVLDNTKTGTATVTIAALVATVTSVSVNPSSIGLNGGAQQQFTATVNGTNSPPQSVTWSANIGSISGSGLYTAPAGAQSVQTATVTATSTFNTQRAGTATVSVAAVGQEPEVPVVTPIEPLGTSAVRYATLGTQVRIVLEFADTPAPRDRTIILGGQSRTITSG